MFDNENDDEDKSANAIKIILVGDSGAGKTNLIAVASGQKFNTELLTTTTCSYMQMKVKIKGNEYKVNLWDTIGQEKYRSLTKIFFKNSKIVFFVYDITCRESFNSLQNWKKTIDDILGEEPLLGVVGNKSDLYLDEVVTEDEGKQYAESIGAKYIYTSAKNDSQSFIKFINELVEDYVTKKVTKKDDDEEIKINKKKHKKKDDKKCKNC